MAFHTAQLQNFSLQGSGVSIADITMTLSTFQTIDGVDLAMSDFGTIGFMTIEPGSRDREEQISFTGVTQNSNGTATLTGIKNVLFLSPYTEVSGFAKSHPGGVVAVVTNTSGFYNKFPAKENNEAITAYWTVPDPISPTDIANRQWVLSVVNGGAVSQNSVIVIATAGETVVAGYLLYFDTTDNEWKKTDADTPSTVMNTLLGIAQGSGTDGNPITGGVLIFGVDTTQTGMTQGDIMYAGNTAGAITSTVGTTPRVVGIARATTSLYFDPSFQNLLYSYAVDAVGTDSYAVTLAEALGAYYPGMIVNFKAGTANTGASTLAINGGSAKAIKKNVTDDLNTGDILANQLVTVIYDGTNFQMTSKSPTLSSTSQIFYATGTYTKPAGLKYVIVEAVGGGAGGGGETDVYSGGGGGGGGGYAKKTILATSLGTTETVTIGAGGAGGVNGTGSVGGNTSFGSFVTANGGAGGIGGTASAIVAGGAGGSASSGDINISGGTGSYGGGASTGSAASVSTGGAGGSSQMGRGGAGTLVAGAGIIVGQIGSGIGGGGSGGASANNAGDNQGGAGTSGFVGVYEYYS